MNYEPLARKYRPQKFEDLVGQDFTVRALRNSLITKKIHPAYIFSGIRGVGKTTIARIFSKGLNCESGITPVPCDKCSSCEEISKGISLDVLEIDGATHTSADEARILSDIAKYTPIRDRFRVFIIDEVHMLSKAAFNSLLKTLEEPPAQAVFIFATTEPHKIPDTIESRAYHFRLKRLTEEMIFKRLQFIAKREQIEIDEEALKLIARYGDGSLRDALTLLDKVYSYAGVDSITEKMVSEVLGVVGRGFLIALAKALFSRDFEKIYNLIEQVYERGDDIERLLSDMMLLLREVLRGKTVEEAKEDIKELVLNVSLEDILKTIDILVAASQKMKQNVDKRVVLELELIKIAYLPLIVPIDKILKYLKEKDKGDEDFSSLFEEEKVVVEYKKKEEEEKIKGEEEPSQRLSEKIEKENLKYTSIIPFKMMDEEEEKSYFDFQEDKRVSLLKSEVKKELPIVSEIIDSADVSMDPNGDLHIFLKGTGKSAFKYIIENVKKIESIAKGIGFKGKVLIQQGEEDIEELKVEEKEDISFPLRNPSEMTLKLKEEFEGTITTKFKKIISKEDMEGEEDEELQ